METKVITAHLPLELASQVDRVLERLDRPKGWAVKQALYAWVAEEEECYQMKLEALKQVDSGRIIKHSDVQNWVNQIHAAH